MASALLETEASNSIVGLILIATKTARPDELRDSLPFPKAATGNLDAWRKRSFGSLDAGMEHIEIFEESGWPVTRFQHKRATW